MRIATCLLMASVFILGSTGCSKSPEDKAAGDMIDLLDGLGDAIASIDDEKSATKAAEKITELAKEFKKLATGTKDFEGEPSEKMQKKMERAQERLQEKLAETRIRLANNPTLMLEIMPALVGLGISMGQL